MSEQADSGRAWRVTGQVQGVGFRPFVRRLADALGLSGSVRNGPGGVTIRASGPPEALAEFLDRLRSEAPPLARIDAVEDLGPAEAGGAFRIEASAVQPGPRGRVTVDAATCADCLSEILDPADRRHRHGLANCTACGPRYTVVRDLPWDRARTTMAGFPMCDRCRAEYEDPADRRHHAQPVCCPECGPRVRLSAPGGAERPGDPYRSAAGVLAAGGILAMKGVGGYHLVADAGNVAALARLRAAKGRDRKPFAVMVVDLPAARDLAVLSPAAERALASPAAPIVLAPPRRGLDTGVSGPSGRVGVMLPGNPMQHLLLREALRPLVMTSGNRSDDPLVSDDPEALRRLAFADAVLAHDRPIERATDDSVLLDSPLGLVPVRRARGFAPSALPLPIPAPFPGFAVGGDLKSAVALADGPSAVLSPHIGDLSHALAWARFVRTLGDLARLLGIEPRFVAADLHPDYASARHAAGLARAAGIPLFRVQHHHAHLASLLAERGRSDRILALACDGVGHGADGAAWGGEVLLGDLLDFERRAFLRPLRLPGGDAAAVEIGRCGLSWLFDVLGPGAADDPAAARAEPDPGRRRAILAMLASGLRCPPSHGAGRLFDAAAALLGVAERNSFEAEAGISLEAAAGRATRRPDGTGIVALRGPEVDPRPLLPRMLEVREADGPEEAAWLFHDALADGLARAVLASRDAGGPDTVGLTGGVFLNSLLAERTASRLAAAGMAVLVNREVPPGDGGIALGQAAVAAARLAAGR